MAASGQFVLATDRVVPIARVLCSLEAKACHPGRSSAFINQEPRVGHSARPTSVKRASDTSVFWVTA